MLRRKSLPGASHARADACVTVAPPLQTRQPSRCTRDPDAEDRLRHGRTNCTCSLHWWLFLYSVGSTDPPPRELDTRPAAMDHRVASTWGGLLHIGHEDGSSRAHVSSTSGACASMHRPSSARTRDSRECWSSPHHLQMVVPPPRTRAHVRGVACRQRRAEKTRTSWELWQRRYACVFPPALQPGKTFRWCQKPPMVEVLVPNHAKRPDPAVCEVLVVGLQDDRLVEFPSSGSSLDVYNVARHV